MNRSVPFALCISVALLIAAAGCSRTPAPAAASTAPAAPAAAEQWKGFVDRFIEDTFVANPFFAVESGRHDFDGRAPDWSADGMVKEGAATNVWIVDRDGTLVTRRAEHGILRGITRTTLIDVAARLGLKIAERDFSVSEMLAAREVFLTAATSICFPVVSVDGQVIANGHPGSISQKIREAFFDVAEKITI